MLKMFAHNLLDGLKGQPHDGLLVVGGGGGEHHEHGLPTALHIANPRQHHLRHAPNDELADFEGFGLAHDDHKGLQEVVLEAEVGQLVPFQKLHGQLPHAVHPVHRHLQVGVAADLHEEVRQHRPDAAPHQPDAGHVEVGDLYDLGEGVDTWRPGGAQLLPGHGTQRAYELHDGLTVQPVRPHVDAVELLGINLAQDGGGGRGELRAMSLPARPLEEGCLRQLILHVAAVLFRASGFG
mmetsp:Transcript_7198/g.21192  ORF Transcript_7198/g.21192 Transcript_7198/m.21192 type:complete len:238 (-) Transcript_7198:3917-4630(-)